MESLDHWLDTNMAEYHDKVVQTVRRLNTMVKKSRRSFDLGDVPTLQKSLEEIERTAGELPAISSSAKQVAQEYDTQAFLKDAFDAEFRRVCAERGMNPEGTYPTYLIPPVTVRVDVRLGRVRVNRKLISGLRVNRVVDAVAAERDRVTRRPFNAKEFLAEIATAYDDLVALESARQGVDMGSSIERTLRDIYRRLTPRNTWRKEYPEAFFAYDIHRLLASDQLYLPDGRRYYLSPSRKSRTNMTILDRNGREVQYGVIAFRKE
ncbi:MAG: hypothetical protein R6U89_01970 [Dehalococcoidia bacterium]